MSEYMREFQGMADYRPLEEVQEPGKRKRKRAAEPVEVMVIAHSADGNSTIRFPNGEQKRVATSQLTMKPSA